MAGQRQRLRRWQRWARQYCLSQLRWAQEDSSFKEWVYVSVCQCTRACVYMWNVSVVCVFPLQVVLSTCLCSWFCLLPAWGWLGDALGGEKWSNKVLSAAGFITQPRFGNSAFPFFFVFLLSSSYHVLTLTCRFHLCQLIPRPCLLPALSSISVSLSLSLSVPFVHHKHFQCWHTREDSHPENRATTIMSMLSSHNNTRITYWGRRALLGTGLQTDPAWSVNTQNCTC